MNTENRYQETDLGNVSPNPRGEYVPGTEYEYLDLVTFEGGSYICLAEPGTTTTEAPESGKNTKFWQCMTIPGDMTPEYVAMHDRVVNLSEQVEADAEEARTAEQNVSGMKENVTQMQEQTRQYAESAEQSKDSAAGYAASADTSRRAAETSEQNINAQVTGFDAHVAEKTSESEQSIEAARIAANKAILAQQEQSVNEVARVGGTAVSEAQSAARVATEKASAASESEKNAKASETAAKLSETNATKMAEQVAADKEQVANDRAAVENAKQEMTGSVAQIEQNTQGITELKGDLDNKITKFYVSNKGETHITDSDNGKIQDMMIYGKSSQDGTPSPENPVEVKSVVNPVVKFTSKDGSKVQTVTLNNITLNAIPVSKGGNVTINGQQYIADYVDVERGKVIRNILKWRLGEFKKGFNNVVWHIDITSLGIDGSKIGLSNMFKIQDGRYNEVTTSEFYISHNGEIASLNMRGMTDEEFKKWLIEKNPEVYNVLKVAEEIPINPEEALALKKLMTYYPLTNVSVNSGHLDGYTVFNYPISMANGWNYVKQQLNDNRDYIYDMDLQSAEAYVNSEYAVALTELEV